MKPRFSATSARTFNLLLSDLHRSNFILRLCASNRFKKRMNERSERPKKVRSARRTVLRYALLKPLKRPGSENRLANRPMCLQLQRPRNHNRSPGLDLLRGVLDAEGKDAVQGRSNPPEQCIVKICVLIVPHSDIATHNS